MSKKKHRHEVLKEKKELDKMFELAKTQKQPYEKVSLELKHFRKKLLIELMGGKCEVCGGEFPDCAMDFHHINPSIKNKTAIGVRIKNYAEKGFWERLVPEVRNECRLLCANCHRVLHWKN